MTPVDEALARLDKHEAECALRYEMIQLQLDEHNRRFDKLSYEIMSKEVKEECGSLVSNPKSISQIKAIFQTFSFSFS